MTLNAGSVSLWPGVTSLSQAAGIAQVIRSLGSSRAGAGSGRANASLKASFAAS